MKKTLLKKNTKGHHQTDGEKMRTVRAAKHISQKAYNKIIRTQFALDNQVYERVKCPVAAMVFCSIGRV